MVVCECVYVCVCVHLHACMHVIELAFVVCAFVCQLYV